MYCTHVKLWISAKAFMSLCFMSRLFVMLSASNLEGERQVEHFDAVEGGVANDRIFRTVELYFAEEISKEDALKRLKYEKPNHQICLLNQRLIDKYLTYIRTEEL